MQDLNVNDKYFLIDVSRLTGFTDSDLTKAVCAWCDVPYNWLRTRRYVLDGRNPYISPDRRDEIVDILNTDSAVLGMRITFDGFEVSADANVSAICRI